MDDKDLNYLHGILRRLEGDTEIRIGLTVWKASDIGWIVEEALQARAWGPQFAKVERKAIGPNDFGAPEDEVRDVVTPFSVPAGTIFVDPKSGAVIGYSPPKVVGEVKE